MKKEGTKVCKYCQSEISAAAKVCPTCRKKQGGKLKWIIIVIVILVLLGSLFGDDEEDGVKKTGEVESNTTNSEEKQEEKGNIFKAGDIVETDDFKITFITAEKFEDYEEYFDPDEGYEYWKFEFKFENISDSDQTVSSMMDWECYADNSKVDQTWIMDDNGLDATLSSGRTTQGSVFFEVPENAESVELEYDINYWQSEKIVFVGK